MAYSAFLKIPVYFIESFIAQCSAYTNSPEKAISEQIIPNVFIQDTQEIYSLYPYIMHCTQIILPVFPVSLFCGLCVPFLEHLCK